MPARQTPPPATRDTRLLVLTLLLSVGVLVLLAQFRFPDRPRAQGVPAATALEQLTTRSAFDDQTSAMRDLARRIGPSIVRLRRAGAAGQPASELTGLRIRDTLALVALQADVRDAGLEAVAADRWMAASIVGRDRPRALAVVRVPAQAAPVLTISDTPPPAPAFLAAVGGDGTGPDIRPVWVGLFGVVSASGWAGTVLAIPPAVTSLPHGSLLFTMGGRLLGLVTGQTVPVLVPAQLLLDRAGLLAEGRNFDGADAGVRVQDVDTPALRTASGAGEGALVTEVDPSGPAVGLQPGEVITRIGAEPIRNRLDFEHALARREGGVPATFTVMRKGTARTVSLALRTAAGPTEPAGVAARTASAAARGLGLTLRQRGRDVEIAAVSEAGHGHAAGLRTGDVITWIPDDAARSPASIERAYNQLEAGGALLLRVRPPTAPGMPLAEERLIAVAKS